MSIILPLLVFGWLWLRRRRRVQLQATPERFLLDSPLSLDSPLGQSPWPSPVGQLDFDNIELEVMDEGGEDRQDVAVVIGDDVGGFERSGDEVVVDMDDDRIGEEEDVEEEDQEEEEDGSGLGDPRRLRRSDRTTKGVPPQRFQAGGP